MGDYSQAAEFYDLLYAGEKDYPAEAEVVAALIRKHCPDAASLLDVGCGTGSHARAFIDAGFQVEGIDSEPAFVARAQAKCPERLFHVGDMTQLNLATRFDAVTCLFSAVGYARTEANLLAAIAGMRTCLAPGGVLIVDPWFEPGQLTNGWIATLHGAADGVSVCRMSRTVTEGFVSRLEFEYLIGTAAGIERRSEEHVLGLFTQVQMEAAFTAAGLKVERMPEIPGTRGLYVGYEG